jgi:DNA mismatch endonuclease (patch repair protein)
MQLQRERDTAPEMALRRELHGRGLRYRVDLAAVPGTRRRIDIAFSRRRIAVFVDGCFWHGCPEHGRRQHKINGWYWPAKIAGNKERDADTGRRLVAAGWTVVRIWEHDDCIEATSYIAELLKQRVGDSAVDVSGPLRSRGTSSPRLGSA